MYELGVFSSTSVVLLGIAELHIGDWPVKRLNFTDLLQDGSLLSSQLRSFYPESHYFC